MAVQLFSYLQDEGFELRGFLAVYHHPVVSVTKLVSDLLDECGFAITFGGVEPGVAAFPSLWEYRIEQVVAGNNLFRGRHFIALLSQI